MSSKDIPPQSTFFYASPWTVEMDSMFLSIIARTKSAGEWGDATHPPGHILMNARAEMKEATGIHLPIGSIFSRLKHFEARYRTFVDVCNAKETYWDRENNQVNAQSKVWRKLIKENKFAEVYYHKDEPEFNKLAVIFGPMCLKEEGGPTVIVISDSTTRNQSPNHVILVNSDSEEVSSPMLLNSNRRRSLFNVDSTVADIESTNNLGLEMKQYPPRNAFLGPPKNMQFNSNSAPSSSCASSSPSKWWNI